MRSSGSPRTEFFVAPAGVASKRHLFEKEMAGQNRTEVASGRKVRSEAKLRVSRLMSSEVSKA
jgi:hypothetical protein